MTLQEVGSFPNFIFFTSIPMKFVYPSVLKIGIAASGLVGFLGGIALGAWMLSILSAVWGQAEILRRADQ